MQRFFTTSTCTSSKGPLHVLPYMPAASAETNAETDSEKSLVVKTWKLGQGTDFSELSEGLVGP